MNPEIKIFVDWDNDGYIHEHKVTGKNLIPNPIYPGTTNPHVVNGSYENLPINDQYGFIERKLIFPSASHIGKMGIRELTNMPGHSLVYGADQFPNVLENGKTYTLSFLAKSPTITQISIDVFHHTLNTTSKITVSSGNLRTITSNYTLITISLGTPTALSGWSIEFTPDSAGDLYVKGYMLVEGTSVPAFSVSPLGQYDDITQYVLSASWKSGRNDYYDVLAYEGTANILLNNDSMLFSPANTESPLFGYFKQNLKIVIKIKNPVTDNWQVMWTGWTDTFGVTPGRTTNRQASIDCNQGIFRLREGEFSVPLLFDAKIDDVVLDIVGDSGWKSVSVPYRTVLDYGYFLDNNSYVIDTRDVFNVLQSGLETYDLVGHNWDRKTKLEAALKEALETEETRLWIDREGFLNLFNRQHFIYNPSKTEYVITADKDVNKINYEFGKYIVNKIEVFTKPKKEVTDSEVWSSRSSLIVPAKTTKIFDMDFNFTEGGAKTVTRVTLENATISVFEVPTKLRQKPTTKLSEEQVKKFVDFSIITRTGNRRQLRIANNFDKAIAVDISLNGDYIEGSGGDVSYIFEDEKSFISSNAIHKDEINSNIIDNETEASAISYSRLQRNKEADGEFTKITLSSRNENWVDLLLSLGLGSFIEITEKQTAEIRKPHIVLAEEFDYSGGVLTANYIIGKLDNLIYAVVGDTIGAEFINMIEQPVEIQARNSSAVEYSGDVIILTSYASKGSWLFGANKNMTRFIPVWNPDSWAFYSAGTDDPRYYNITVNDGIYYFPTVIQIRAGVNHTDVAYYAFLEQVNNNSADKATEVWYPLIPGKKYRAQVYTRQISGTLQASSIRLRYNTTTYLRKTGGGDAIADFTPSALNVWERFTLDFDAVENAGGTDVSIGGIILDTATTSLHIKQFAGLEIWNIDGAENKGETSIPVINGESHTFVMWAKLQDGESSETYDIKIYDANYNQIASTSQLFTCKEISYVTFNFTPSVNRVFIELSRQTTPSYTSRLFVYGIGVVKNFTPQNFNDLQLPGANIMRLYI